MPYEDLIQEIANDRESGAAIIARKCIACYQAFFVGADCVTSKYFINKIGTKTIAEAANRCEIPFYVVADTLKFIQEKEPSSKLFEKVPLSLVDSVISENGFL